MAAYAAPYMECRSGFMTLSPDLLQEQPAVVLLFEEGFGLLVVSSGRTW
jgi:hypothetical protein